MLKYIYFVLSQKVKYKTEKQSNKTGQKHMSSTTTTTKILKNGVPKKREKGDPNTK